MSCIILDLEATGLHPEKGDTIIDVAIVRVGADGIEERFQSLVHPGDVEVTPFIQALTGISTEMLKDAPKRSEVLEQIRDFIGETLPIIGHNISFDCDFLRVLGLKISKDREIDTCDFATLYFPHAPSHSLEVLSTYLHLPHVEKHRAMGDVLATYALLEVLIAKRDAAPAFMKDAAFETLRKSPTWPGRHFFDLQTPSKDPKIALEKMIKDLVLDSAPEVEGVHQFVLQPSVERSLEWSLSQKVGSCTLVPPAEVDSYRDRVHTDKRGLYFDAPHQFLSPEKVEAFLGRDTWTPEEALFGLRLRMLAPKDAFVHVSSLSITHRERSMVGIYTATDADVPNILKGVEEKHLFVTYYAWHTHREHMPKNLWIIPDAMRLELYLHQTAKKYLSQDMLLSKVKSFAARCDSQNIETQDLVESLEFVLRYAFSGLAKLLKSDDREVALNSVPEILTSFQGAWEKGFIQWKERIMRLEHTSKEDLLRQCQQLAESISLFSEGIKNARRNTAIVRINQGILLQQELLNLDEEKSWLQETQGMHLLQGYVDESFSLFMEPKSRTEIDLFPKEQICFEQQYSRNLLNVVKPEAITESVLKYTDFHSFIFCTGSGSNIDRAFDPIYDTFHGADVTVLSSGKTGGRGKVRFNFSHAERSVLISTPKDAKGLGVYSDAILLSSLPFPAVMSTYWKKAYGERSFGLLTLPLLTQDIIDVLWASWDPSSSEKSHLFITDGRFFDKHYGQEVAEVLAQYMTVV